MLFLLPFVEDLNSSTTSNLPERLDTDEESQPTSQVHDDRLDTLSGIDIDIAPQASPSPSQDLKPGPSQDAQHGPSNSAMHRPTTHNVRKRRYPVYPQSRASQVASPFDVAMLDALKSLQQQQVKDDEHFLMSLLPVMKSLDPINKFEFRGELNNTALRYLRLSQQPRDPNLESTSTGTASASTDDQYSQYSSSSYSSPDEPYHYQYHQFQN
ncbi:hypothetical protein PoB_004770700 [Plakobranchus ocellatus]|uniref:BESS domain-containing protein n=1 Tax=Plakobranchus ocellatus TaxID=259542 RepID=A0AAV4BPA4_9GAST|nr:hypothetical protein PoB_004770700 [Plakobranchus ocellatus]